MGFAFAVMLRVCLLAQQRCSIGGVDVTGGDVGESLSTSSTLLLSALSASFVRAVDCELSRVGVESGVVVGVRELSSSLLLSKTFSAASLHVGIGGIFLVGVEVIVDLGVVVRSLLLSLLVEAASVVVVSHLLSSPLLLKTASRASSQVGTAGPVIGVGVSG